MSSHNGNPERGIWLAAAGAAAVLLLQTAVYYGLPSQENTPKIRALETFPAEISPWTLSASYPLEDEVQQVLKADQTINRLYSSGQTGINLFVAYFHSQKSGVAPHSPKNCLPGSGWAPTESGTTTVAMADGRQLEVNRYIVARGDNKSLVFYWYQTPYRVIASEYWAKIYLVLDSIRYNRSDTALVRVVAPLPNGREAEAEAQARQFIQKSFPALNSYFNI
jgi:EpsI family protein